MREAEVTGRHNVTMLSAIAMTLVVTACTGSPRPSEGSIAEGDAQVPMVVEADPGRPAPTPVPADDVALGLELAQLDPATGKIERMFPSVDDVREPELSPDGARLVYQSAGRTPQIFVRTTEGTRRLTHFSGGAVEPAWSPDGSQIAFAAAPRKHGGRDTDIFVMDADGRNQRQLADTFEDDRRPDWSPDGSRLVFDAGATLWVVDLEDLDLTRLTSGSTIDLRHGPPADPTWSPDGEWIALTRFAPGAINDIVPHAHLWVIRADGSTERPLERPRENWMDWQLEPTWSPDGTSIAFIDHPSWSTEDVVATNDLRTRIGIVDVRTREVRYIQIPQPMADLSWGTDGIIATIGDDLHENPYFRWNDRDPWFEG